MDSANELAFAANGIFSTIALEGNHLHVKWRLGWFQDSSTEHFDASGNSQTNFKIEFPEFRNLTTAVRKRIFFRDKQLLSSEKKICNFTDIYWADRSCNIMI